VTDTSTTVQAHINAVLAMLIGNGRVRTGLIGTGGAAPSQDLIVYLAEAATASDSDILYLTVEQRQGRETLTNLHVIAPREACCYVYPRCRLWLAADGRRAAILPTDDVRGYFMVEDCEIVHIDGKPTDLAGGTQRAEATLRQIVAALRMPTFSIA
jgi:hypothetical protein